MFKRKHTFTSAKADGADATLVRPGNWNADHDLAQELTNRTGGGIVSGDICALSAANDESVILSDVAANQRPYVVAMATIADTILGLFAGPGMVWTMRVAASTTRGNWLVKSATSKAADDSGVAGTNPPPLGTIGLALTGTVGAGTVVALIGDTTYAGLGFKGADIASGAALTIPRGVTYAHITGVTTVTSIGSLPAGTLVALEFDGVLTLTHNATTLILQGDVNHATVAGEVLWFMSEGAGNWREVAKDREVLVDLILTSFVQIGTNPAASGAVRLANLGKVAARNAANSADKDLIHLDASDRVTLSDGTQQIRPNGPVRCDIDNKGFVLPNTFAS